MSNSVWPHRQQPTRLPCPCDSPSKNTGVGCHFLLQCRKVKSESEIAQSYPTLSDPMDCSLPGSSVHGIFPGKSTGVGCHRLLRNTMATLVIYQRCYRLAVLSTTLTTHVDAPEGYWIYDRSLWVWKLGMHFGIHIHRHPVWAGKVAECVLPKVLLSFLDLKDLLTKDTTRYTQASNFNF